MASFSRNGHLGRYAPDVRRVRIASVDGGTKAPRSRRGRGCPWGIVAVCDPDDANAVELALTSANKRTAVQIASLTAQRLTHQMTRPSDEPTTSD